MSEFKAGETINIPLKILEIQSSGPIVGDNGVFGEMFQYKMETPHGDVVYISEDYLEEDISDINLTFTEYQKEIEEFAVYPKVGTGDASALSYCGLGLAGETGEVSEHLKKLLRDNNGVLTLERREALFKELGDVLWYLSRLAGELGFDMTDVAQANIDKLRDRLERNVIHGDGDNR